MRLKSLPFILLFLLPALPAMAGGLDLKDLLSIRRACGDDIKTLCAGTERGNGRVAQCMMVHAASVSPGCASVLRAEKAKFPAATVGTQPYDTD